MDSIRETNQGMEIRVACSLCHLDLNNEAFFPSLLAILSIFPRLDYQPLFGKMSLHSSKTGPRRWRKSSLYISYRCFLWSFSRASQGLARHAFLEPSNTVKLWLLPLAASTAPVIAPLPIEFQGSSFPLIPIKQQ